jgi:hypothetical protein
MILADLKLTVTLTQTRHKQLLVFLSNNVHQADPADVATELLEDALDQLTEKLKTAHKPEAD